MSDKDNEEFLEREREAMAEFGDDFLPAQPSPTTLQSLSNHVDEANIDMEEPTALIDVNSFENPEDLQTQETFDPFAENTNQISDESESPIPMPTESFSSKPKPVEVAVPTENVYRKEWKKMFDQRLADNAAAAKVRHEEILQKAKQDIEQFYKDYNAKVKQNEKNDLQEQACEQEQLSEGNTWDQIYCQVEKMCRPKNSRDISRMKQILASMRTEITK